MCLKRILRAIIPASIRSTMGKFLWKPRYTAGWILHRYFRKPYLMYGIKVSGGLHITETVHRYFLSGSYEGDEAAVLAKTLVPEDKVLELGAGVGLLSTICARQLGSGKVVCVEANPRMIPVIKRTHRLNDVDPEVLSGMVSSTENDSSLNILPDFYSSSALDRKSAEGRDVSQKIQRVQVKCFALENLLEQYRPSYLICDIEGGEIEIFKNFNLPESVRCLLIEFHPHIVGSQPIEALVTHLELQGFQRDQGRDKVQLFVRASLDGNSAIPKGGPEDA